MKSLLMIAATAVITLQAGGFEVVGENTVVLYVENRLCPKDDFAARRQVQQMFASAGVRIVWRDGAPSLHEIAGERPIIIHFVLHTEPSDHPGALAFAFPFEGTHLRVFYHRVRFANPQWTQAVLAHVLVHEITHLLQRLDRHSESGIMKAHWTSEDYREMTFQPLPFIPADIELIRAGLNIKKRPSVVPISVATQASQETETIWPR